MDLAARINHSIRDVKNFPKEGILFKDITPILKDTALTHDIAQALSKQASECAPDVVVAMESRGFWFGMLISQILNIPFVPIRKLGKLPYETFSYSYELEYGKATLEIHKDGISKGQRVLVHDDILATGGTAVAAAELIKLEQGVPVGFFFISELQFLQGREKLQHYTHNIFALTRY